MRSWIAGKNIARQRHTSAVSDRKEMYISAVGDRAGFAFEAFPQFMLDIVRPSVFRSSVLFVEADLCCTTLICLAIASSTMAACRSADQQPLTPLVSLLKTSTKRDIQRVMTDSMH